MPTDSANTAMRAGLKVTWVGLCVNLLLVVAKLIVGVIATSQALIADGVHSLSDLISDIVVIVGLKWGRAEADANHPFGHGRIETVAGLAVGVLLIAAAVWIGYSAIVSFAEEHVVSSPLDAVIVAAGSILLKEALYHYTVAVGRHIHSQAVVGNAWHHRTDAFSSVVVLIGLIVGWVIPSWYWADGVAAIIVALLVAKVGVDIAWQGLKKVVDTAPSNEIVAKIIHLTESIDGVYDAHDIKARYSGASLLAEIHIVVHPDQSVRDGHSIAKQVEATLLENIDRLDSVIIHVDPATLE